MPWSRSGPSRSELAIHKAMHAPRGCMVMRRAWLFLSLGSIPHQSRESGNANQHQFAFLKGTPASYQQPCHHRGWPRYCALVGFDGPHIGPPAHSNNFSPPLPSATSFIWLCWIRRHGPHAWGVICFLIPFLLYFIRFPSHQLIAPS
jgi:hypothetical protein